MQNRNETIQESWQTYLTGILQRNIPMFFLIKLVNTTELTAFTCSKCKLWAHISDGIWVSSSNIAIRKTFL